MVLFTKESMYADKPVPMVNILPLRFIDGPINQGIKGNIQGAWYQEILVDVITMICVPVEEALVDIRMNSIKVVIQIYFDGKASWVISLGALWPTQSVYQWAYWITNPSSVDESPNINYLVAVFSGTNKNESRTDSGINSWV